MFRVTCGEAVKTSTSPCVQWATVTPLLGQGGVPSTLTFASHRRAQEKTTHTCEFNFSTSHMTKGKRNK